MNLIDHITLGVQDIDKSTSFYDAILSVFDLERLYSEQDDDGHIAAIGYGRDGKASFWICRPLDETKPAKACNGTHIAFKAASEIEVQNFYDAALKNGGQDCGKPGLRPEYHTHYYAAFVYDPEGHKLEAVFGNA